MSGPFLSRAFILCVLCLAVFQFSENTADPDLWGHVYFGAQLVQTGKPTEMDVNSWTAWHLPSFDHEYLGEAVFGAAFLLLGGPGLLLLKMAVGLLTFALALSLGCQRLDSKMKLAAWAFGALAVVEISFGFAARPQVFTALLLGIELWLLNRIHRGQWRWTFVLPPMFALWFNLHGGSLAGLILLFAAAGASSVQLALTRFVSSRSIAWLDPGVPRSAIPSLWISAIVSAATVVLNPHGAEFAEWLVGSVLWLRPQIQEWNPAALNWDHAAFFFCGASGAAAFALSRRRRQLWEIAVLMILFVVAFRAVRNTPLFCIAALALVPPHLADVLQRYRNHFARFENSFKSHAVQRMVAIILLCTSLLIIAATFTLHKKHFWTMEIPRAQYPVAAVDFIQKYNLHGNVLVFFDWGEMCIWDLPDTRVSIDGRLDSVYPADVIAAHWRFYNAEPFDTNALNLARADYALLPSDLAGALALKKEFGWTPVYYDNLAVVLVRNPGEFPDLTGLQLPVQGPPDATDGRDAFPNRKSFRNENSR